jgi:tripartite-type tricarboxylate transporter receptor subunit TctC
MFTSRIEHRAPMGLRCAKIAVYASLLLPLGTAGAALADDYYAGKTFTVVVGSNPGGGTDTTARLVARYWGDHIPGKPNVLVRNKPSQVIAANELQHSTRPDGLSVNVFAGAGSLGPYTRKSKAVKYDPLTWNFIGSVERGSTILMIRKSELANLKNPKAEPVAVGSVSTDRPQDAMAVFGSEQLGWNIKFVLGYPSSNEMYLAFERGEIDMFGSGTTKIINRFLKSGEAMPLAAETERRDFPDVPTFEKLLGDKKPTGNALKVFQAWAGPSSVDKYFAAAPKTPENLLQILRASFKAATDDPAFEKQAEATLGDAFQIFSGPKVRDIIENIVAVSPEVTTLANNIRKKYGLPLITKLK